MSDFFCGDGGEKVVIGPLLALGAFDQGAMILASPCQAQSSEQRIHERLGWKDSRGQTFGLRSTSRRSTLSSRIRMVYQPSKSTSARNEGLAPRSPQEMINLQREGAKAKQYQVRQVRAVILKYRLQE